MKWVTVQYSIYSVSGGNLMSKTGFRISGFKIAQNSRSTSSKVVLSLHIELSYLLFWIFLRGLCPTTRICFNPFRPGTRLCHFRF